jgi:hypothetical protein
MQAGAAAPAPGDLKAFVWDLTSGFAAALVYGEPGYRGNTIATPLQRRQGFAQAHAQGADYTGTDDGDASRRLPA